MIEKKSIHSPGKWHRKKLFSPFHTLAVLDGLAKNKLIITKNGYYLSVTSKLPAYLSI
jgi:hypothetical protein